MCERVLRIPLVVFDVCGKTQQMYVLGETERNRYHCDRNDML